LDTPLYIGIKFYFTLEAYENTSQHSVTAHKIATRIFIAVSFTQFVTQTSEYKFKTYNPRI
jgi:hypothetical protein